MWDSFAGQAGSSVLPAPVRAEGWLLHACDQVESTSDLAATLPAWCAVLARTQSAGRGQYRRSFVSDEGGLWLSLVVPSKGGAAAWVGFSLVVGWHLREVLREIGVGAARLRWPNDLMVGSRKLGGILIEQGGPETLVVGIGINLNNEPWARDRELAAIATRVADHAPSPTAEELCPRILTAVRAAHQDMQEGGLAHFRTRLNTAWGAPRRVTLDLGPGREAEGGFGGVDARGNLLVWTEPAHLQVFPSHHVRRLRERPLDGDS